MLTIKRCVFGRTHDLIILNPGLLYSLVAIARFGDLGQLSAFKKGEKQTPGCQLRSHLFSAKLRYPYLREDNYDQLGAPTSSAIVLVKKPCLLAMAIRRPASGVYRYAECSTAMSVLSASHKGALPCQVSQTEFDACLPDRIWPKQSTCHLDTITKTFGQCIVLPPSVSSSCMSECSRFKRHWQLQPKWARPNLSETSESRTYIHPILQNCISGAELRMSGLRILKLPSNRTTLRRVIGIMVG